MCAFRNLSLALSHMLMPSNLMTVPICKGMEYMDEQGDTGSGISTSLPSCDSKIKGEKNPPRRMSKEEEEKKILRILDSSKRGLARTHPGVCLYMGENKCAAVIGP